MNQSDLVAARDRLARLEAYLQSDPENERLRADVFDAALSVGRLDVAAREVALALARTPSDAAWEHRRGLVHLASKDHAGAQRVFEGLIARGDGAPAIIHNLAYSVFSQGDREGAARIVEPLLARTDGDGAAAWTLWLRCQHHLDRIRVGLDAFRKRVESGLPSPESLGVASLMALDAEFMTEAEAWSTAALRGRDGQVEALITRGTLALAQLRGEEALSWYARALEVRPDDGRTWSGVAFAKMLLQDLPGADEAFGKAVRNMPDHVGTWIGWGWLGVITQSLDDALTRFQAAVEVDRNFGESHGCTAVVLARLGRKIEAEQAVEVALRLDAKSVAARYAQAILAGKGEDPDMVRLLLRATMRWGRE